MESKSRHLTLFSFFNKFFNIKVKEISTKQLDTLMKEGLSATTDLRTTPIEDQLGMVKDPDEILSKTVFTQHKSNRDLIKLIKKDTLDAEIIKKNQLEPFYKVNIGDKEICLSRPFEILDVSLRAHLPPHTKGQMACIA